MLGNELLLGVLFSAILLGFSFSQDANAVPTDYLYEFGTGDGQLGGPIQASLNSLDVVYVIENGNDRVSVFDSTGAFQFKFGSFGTGNGQFIDPAGIVVGPSDDVYVLDKNNRRVQIFDPAGNYLGQFGSIGSANGQFNLPQGIAVDKFENIYVADTFNQRIQKFDSIGNHLLTFGNGFGQLPGFFKDPSTLAIADNGDIYVTDTRNHRVQVFDSTGAFQFKFGSFGTGDGQFQFEARGIGIDDEGNVFVGDLRAHRYQVFDLTGNFITSFGSFGSGNGQFNLPPASPGFDSVGNIYIADSRNHRVQVFGSIPDPVTTDHYLAYDVKETKHTDKFEKITVELSDQFETGASYTVEKPHHLYNPVQKTHDGSTTDITDDDSHYVGYKIKTPKGESKFEKVTNVLVQNQFGDIIVDVKKPKLLLVPSAKDHFTTPDPLDLPITVNHFKCYDVKESKDTPKFVKRIISVFDPNFDSPGDLPQDFEVKKPKMLCNPVEKQVDNADGTVEITPIQNPENHLMCYDIKKLKDDPKFEKISVFTNNQFGPEQLDVKKEKLLCVPSIKTLP